MPETTSECVIEGCPRPNYSAGHCKSHRRRLERYGSATAGPPLRPYRPLLPYGTPPETVFWSKVDKAADCWIWTAAIAGNGYGVFSYRLSPGKWRMVQAHRYSREIANGSIPTGLFVCHHCDNKLCVNPAHLFVGTNAENMIDMNRKGRGKTRKLTPERVLEIRQSSLKDGELARILGVARSTVNKARNGRHHAHVAADSGAGQAGQEVAG